MQTRTLVLILAAITFSLSGCGTMPTPITQAKVVPKERILAKIPVASSNPATLTLIRDSGLLGAEHVFEFWVNGLKIAELNSGEIISTPVDPGAVIVEVRMFNVLGQIAPAQVETILSPGRSYVYRAGIDDTPRLHLSRDIELSK